MDDRFLNQMRREPRPEFARSLRSSLRRHDTADEPRRAYRPAFTFALAVLAVALAFTFPSGRCRTN